MKTLHLLILGILLIPTAQAAITLTDQGGSYASPALLPAVGNNPRQHPSLPLIMISGTDVDNSGSLGVNARLYYMGENYTYMTEVLDSNDFVPPIAGARVITAWNQYGTQLAVTGRVGTSVYLRLYNFTGGISSPSFEWTGGNITSVTYSSCLTQWEISWVNETTFAIDLGGCSPHGTQVYFHDSSGTHLEYSTTAGRSDVAVAANRNGWVTHSNYVGGSCSSPYLDNAVFNSSSSSWEDWTGTISPAVSSASNCPRSMSWSPNGDYLLVCSATSSSVYKPTTSDPLTFDLEKISLTAGTGGTVTWSPDSTVAWCQDNLASFNGFRLAANGTWFDYETITFSPASSSEGAATKTYFLLDGAHILTYAYSGGKVNLFSSNETFPYPSAPNAPSNLTGEGTCNGAFLSWNYTADITSYQINRASADDASSQVGTADGNGTSWLDRNMTAGATYDYYVNATNDEGTGEASYTSVSVPDNSAFSSTGPCSLIGNTTDIAEGLFGSTTEAAVTAAKFFMGLLFVVGVGGGLAFSVHPIAGAFGAVGALLFVTILGWWSPWILIFAAVAILAAFYAFKGRGEA